MDETCARELIALNNFFYRAHAASFSATRGAAWMGWERIARILEEHLDEDNRAARMTCRTAGPSLPAPLRVLDIACGNMRFARFLASALPKMRIAYHGIDSCAPLAQTAEAVGTTLPADADTTLAITFHEADILEQLLAQQAAAAEQDAAGGPAAPAEPTLPAGDLVVCFGFMHHVPGFELRAALLRALLELARPGGTIAISFWQFMDSERLAAKARHADALAATNRPPWPGFDPAALEPGDHFLGWQDDAGPLRFCHHASEAELDRLVAALPADKAEECARFSADGKSGRLNRYLVLRRR